MSTTASPLYSLTKQDVKFVWGAKQQAAFESLKQSLASDTVLAHYDPAKPLGVAADASAYGLGAVLFLKESDGSERPIYFASRVLSEAEKNYSQVEKESLAIVFALKRFERYVSGRQFTLYTDHRPLLKIFGPNEETPCTTSARLQRWALFLGAFDYKIGYKKSAEHANADGLSRHPVSQPESVDSEISRIQQDRLEELPVDWRQIRQYTMKDQLLLHASYYTRAGWPEVCPKEELRPYWIRRNELSIQSDCL